MPKESPIADEAFALEFAIAAAEGAKRGELAETFGINPDTATKWLKDPRVTVHLKLLMEQRIENISRKIDNEIQKRLLNEDSLKKMDTKVLLDIRKTLIPPPRAGDKPRSNNDEDAQITEVWNMIEDNPELAAAMREMFNPSAAQAPTSGEPDGDE